MNFVTTLLTDVLQGQRLLCSRQIEELTDRTQSEAAVRSMKSHPDVRNSHPSRDSPHNPARRHPAAAYRYRCASTLCSVCTTPKASFS